MTNNTTPKNKLLVSMGDKAYATKQRMLPVINRNEKGVMNSLKSFNDQWTVAF
jgi:hypothetical protein